MKKTKFLAITLALPLLAGACSNQQKKDKNSQTAAVEQQATSTATATVAENVDAIKFKELITSQPGKVVDVRTPGEYASGHLENSTNINFYDDSFDSQIAKLDKNTPIYLYCASGNRSGQAMRKMAAMGYTKVYNLMGGIRAWQSNGFKVVQ